MTKILTSIKRALTWLLEDTSVKAPQPIRPERIIYALYSERVDRVVAREWLGR